jgi:hypothetical protein
MRSTWLRIALLFALPAAAVACGSDAPSLESWQERAQETCEEFEDTADELSDDLFDAEDLDEVADVLEEAAPDFEEFADDLKGLGTPSEDGDEVEDFYTTLDEQVELLGELQAAAEDEDEDDVAELDEEFADLAEDYDEAAEELDIEDCVFG